MNETQNHYIHIAYATDDNYAQHVGVSLLSLFLNTDSPSLLYIYILSNKLSATNRYKLLKIAENYNGNLTFIDCDNLSNQLPSDVDIANLSLSTYYRLFLSELFPENINKIIYLDCDTFINGDIAQLYNLDLDDAFIGGVEDTMYKNMKTNIYLHEEASYFNAGVLLINLDKWRKAQIIKDFIAFINSFNGRVPHLDQGVLNGVLKERKKIIPLKYNVQAPIFAFHKYSDMLKFFSMKNFYSEKEFLDAKKEPVIIHYTSFFLERPWFKFCIHPLRDKYRQLLVLSPFESKLQTDKISIFQKVKDLCFKYFQSIYLRIR